MRNIIAVIVFGVACFGVGFFVKSEKVITNSETIIERDTVFSTDTLPIDIYVPIHTTIIDTFWKPQIIDTAAILQAYFNKNAYSDTLVNDSALLIVINDTISQNKIQSRLPFITRRYPTITQTNTIYATKDEWFVGGYLGQSYGAEITFRRNKNLFSVGGGNNGVYLKYSRKIK